MFFCTFGAKEALKFFHIARVTGTLSVRQLE